MIITRTAVPGRHDGAHARHPGIHPRLDHLAADPPRAGELAAAGQSAGHLPRRIRLRRRRPAWRRQHPAIPAPLRRLRALLRLRHLLRRPRPLRRRSPAHRPPRRNTPGSPRHRLHRPPRRHRAWTRELTLNELTGLPTKHGAGMVLGVANEHARRLVGNFDAVTATVAAVAGLSPAKVYLAFHCSAASKMSCRLAAR